MAYENSELDDAAETERFGVHGGKVTHRTDGADQAMVVSDKPIVLGNMPDLAQQHRFEKIAFMGQTLVEVWGGRAAGRARPFG